MKTYTTFTVFAYELDGRVYVCAPMMPVNKPFSGLRAFEVYGSSQELSLPGRYIIENLDHWIVALKKRGFTVEEVQIPTVYV